MHTEGADVLGNGIAATNAQTDVHPPRWICPLAETGILAIGGKDSASFLQGQTTCDILGLAPGQTTLGAFCNPKGRVTALFRAFKSEPLFYLLLPRELTAATQKRLRLYVLRAEVKIEDVSSEWLVFGVGGENLKSSLEPFGIPVPLNPNDIVCQPDCFAIRISSESTGRVLLMARLGKAEALRAALGEKERFIPADASRWRLEDIQAGIPWVVQATSEEFVPQMLNLDLLGGVSFSKGCYTGQEIVARTHYLGNLKRRMYRVQCPEGESPQAGDPIHETAQDVQSAGMVVVSAPTPEGNHQMLAVLHIAPAENGELRLHGPSGSKLSVLPLPYRQAVSLSDQAHEEEA